jgi:hypothetical protein
VASSPSSKGSSGQDVISDFLQSLLPADSKWLGYLPKSMRRSARWMAIGAGTTCLLAWNGRLVLSTGAGVGMLLLAYSMKETGWRAAIADLVNLLEGLNQRIALSVLSGAGATLGTYLALSIWLETENHWLATGMILQGTATMGTLGFLLWQHWAKQPRSIQTQNPNQLDSSPNLSQCLADLTHPDLLKRLIAVRQINQQISDRPDQQIHIAEYYRILLSRETDTTIQAALLDGLAQISQYHPLKSIDKRSSHNSQILPQAPGLELTGAWQPPVRAKEPVEIFEHN